MQAQRKARIHKIRLEEGAKKAAEELEKCMNCLSFWFSDCLKIKNEMNCCFSVEQMILAVTQMLLEIHTRHSLLLDS